MNKSKLKKLSNCKRGSNYPEQILFLLWVSSIAIDKFHVYSMSVTEYTKLKHEEDKG